MTEYNIRLAAQDDKIHLISMCYNFFQKSPFNSQRFDPVKVNRILDEFLNGRKEEYIIFVLTHNELPVGMLAARAVPQLFSDDYMAIEQIWWIDPEHRGRHSLKLLEIYEHWAKHVGTSFATLSDLEQNSLEKIYTRKGYSLTEKSYIKVF